MPSGYTAPVIDGEGIDFEQFALNCTRAFIFQVREVPLGEPLPEKFEPDDTYARERLAASEAELAEVEAWNEEEAETAAAADYQREVEADAAAAAKAVAAAGKLKALLAQARKWKPPTPTHERFRDFMIEQLQDTLEMDGTHKSYHRLERQTGEQFKAVKIQAAKDRIARHKDDIEKAAERAKEATDWLAAVRGSLS